MYLYVVSLNTYYYYIIYIYNINLIKRIIIRYRECLHVK